MNFSPYYPNLSSNLGEFRYEGSAGNARTHCEFRETRRREGRTFLTAVGVPRNPVTFRKVTFCPAKKEAVLYHRFIGGTLKSRFMQATSCTVPTVMALTGHFVASHFCHAALAGS